VTINNRSIPPMRTGASRALQGRIVAVGQMLVEDHTRPAAPAVQYEQREARIASAGAPSVSVVIPTLNEERTVGSVLQRLRDGLRVREIASFEAERRHGESNLSAWRDGRRVFGTLLRERFGRREVPDSSRRPSVVAEATLHGVGQGPRSRSC
jgi:hypothetical protein